jgi:undecaprenyl-diphosphatase
MSLLQVVVLALIQGLAELLPVSSSAHVVVAEKLMKLDPTTPQMTLLLVMLHTGTMLSVIVYFWRAWKETYFASTAAFNRFVARLLWATLLTGLLGEALRKFLEHALFRGAKSTDIEQLFGRLDLIAPALAAAGVLILVSGLLEARRKDELPLTVSSEAFAESLGETSGTVTVGQATWMGLVQGLALPFRGFSRSGSTISTGMLVGAPRQRAERFSFALAVVLTPVVLAVEGLRLEKASRAAVSAGTYVSLRGSLGLSAVGMVFSFLAGLAALKWLSSWLDQGRWHLFGIYCLVASAGVWYLHMRGF